jgi:hypothetical protein
MCVNRNGFTRTSDIDHQQLEGGNVIIYYIDPSDKKLDDKSTL